MNSFPTHRHLGVRIHDGVETGRRLGAVQPDGEEHLLVLLHGGKDLAVQVVGALVRLLLAGLALGVGLLFLLILFVALFVFAVRAAGTIRLRLLFGLGGRRQAFGLLELLG